MKNLNVLIITALLASTGITYAQTTAPQSTPEQTSVPTTPTSEKKEEFAAPQTPVRPANTPSEDTLIKGQVSSGAIIKDTLMPSATKNNKISRRKSRKRGMNADTALINTRTDSIRKP